MLTIWPKLRSLSLEIWIRAALYCSLNPFIPDDTTLVTVVPLHVEVTVVSNGEYMGWQFSNLLVGIQADLLSSVDGQQLVRVDGH